MEAEELSPAPSHMIGPVWRTLRDGSWYLPEYSVGWDVIEWMNEYLLMPGGPRAGENFEPTLEQVRFLLWWYAVDENGKFIYRNGTLRRMKGWGKDPLCAAMALAELCGPVAFSHMDEEGIPVGKRRHGAWIQIAAVSQDQPLSLDTEVPTSRGWVTVGDLKVGDYVFGSDGHLHEVVRETEVLEGLDCYIVRLDDGTEIVASESHGWTTQKLEGHGGTYRTAHVTTKELSETISGSKGRKSHKIPVVGFESDDIDLLVDPWFVGLWLGDGRTSDSSVVFNIEYWDEYQKMVTPLVSEFQEVVWTKRETTNGSWGEFRIKNKDRSRDSDTYVSKLRSIGVLNNKHIPDEYMNAGTNQRIALLQGMVDSDGGVDTNGRCYFVNSNTRLVYQFQELVIGLGFRCTVRKHGKALRAEFNPGTRITVSRLEYKYSRQRSYGPRNRSQYRWIESVTKTESVPVKCIGIDTQDHLFQVTRNRILTHNTRNTFSLFPSMASKRLKQTYGLDLNRTIIYTNDGGTIEAVTSSPHSMEGRRPTFVVQNETQWWLESNSGHAMAGVVKGNVTKGAYGQSRCLSICNAHIPGQDSVAERDWEAYQVVQSGLAPDVGFFYDALEAPADTPVSEIPSKTQDPDGYERGVKALRAGIEVARGDAVWLDVDGIVADVLDVRNPITESRRKFLNQINASEDSWLSPPQWDMCKKDLYLQPGDKITLGFDGSKGNDFTALVACRVDDAAIFPIRVWNPKQCEYGEIPRAEVDSVVRATIAKYDVVAMRADVKEFESYVDAWAADFGKKMKIKASPGHAIAFDMRGNLKRFALDCERFLDAVLSGEIQHDGSPVLRQHILNAHINYTQYDSISIRKVTKDSSRKIDAAVCAVLAFGARQELLATKNPSKKAAVLR